MPSWLSPRVGTVPQAGQSDRNNKKKERRSKQPEATKKGITLEDLKKQTALRLAHEQKKRPQDAAKAPPQVPVHALQPGLPVNPARAPHHGMIPPYSYDINASVNMQGTVPPLAYGAPYIPMHTSQPQAPTFAPEPSDATTGPHVASRHYSQQDASRDVNSSKLPHGLTVQELKEMTKARLQAEAAKKNPAPALVSTEYRDPSPSEASSGPVGSFVPVSSPTPTGKSRQRLPSRDGLSQGSRGGEAFDDGASVNSATSDLRGSESGFPIGPASFGRTEPSQSPFAPNRAHLGSYGSVGGVETLHASPPPESKSSSDFYQPNRRRAQTLSPRPDFAYDDGHQVMSGQNLPGLPSFSSPSNRQYPRFANQSNVQLLTGFPTESAMIDASSSRTRAFSQGFAAPSQARAGVAPGLVGDNRPRTSSAASLPAMSHTAEEFFMLEPTQLERPSLHRFSSDFGVLVEEEAAPRSSVTGLADVFRKTPLPGFDAPTTALKNATTAEVFASTSVTSSFSSMAGGFPPGVVGDTRSRASTWAPGSMFGKSSALLSVDPHDSYIDDLAKILKLSGNDELSHP